VTEPRSDIVDWLIKLCDRFTFSSETLFLTVDIFDRFLQMVKAQSKYLRCIAVTCLYIAAKINEEDEVIPVTNDLVRRSGCGCSEAEILRMERCILAKFDWCPRSSPTAVEFIHLYQALVVSQCPQLIRSSAAQTKCLQTLTDALLICLHSGDALAYPPSTLALSVLSLYLELTWTHWLPATQILQALVQLDDEDLIACRRLTSQCLGTRLLHSIITNNKLTLAKVLPKFPDQFSLSLTRDQLKIIRECGSPARMLEYRVEKLSYDANGEVKSLLHRDDLNPSPSLPRTPHPPTKRRKVEQDDDVYDDIRKLYGTDDAGACRDVIDASYSITSSSSCTGQAQIGGIAPGGLSSMIATN